MTERALFLLASAALIAACHDTTTTPTEPNPQSVSVLTQHNDNMRTGWNDNEKLLTTSNVNAQRFGKLLSLAVDGQLYAQPLVVGKLGIGEGEHNVVFLASVSNTVYAYDGDNGHLYWQRNYTVPGMRPPRNTDMSGACGGGYQDFSDNIGIVGTPVIDAPSQRMYFVARSTSTGSFVQHLHAVNLVDGTEIAGSPVNITATYPGTGAGNVNGTITFDAQKQNQRQALTLVNGVVYVSFSSHCDWNPYHGWVLGYDASTLQRQVVYNATPGGDLGGMWQSGMGMAADAAGALYLTTGNGTVGVNNDPTNVLNRGSSALKLTRSGSTLSVASWFTPFNYEYLNTFDIDYGSMGSVLIPSSNYWVTGGKDGKLYLLNKDNMGGYNASANQVQQEIFLNGNANMHCQAAYYKGSATEYFYVWSENDPLRALPFDRTSNLLDANNQKLFSQGGPMGQSGAMLSVSSNGSQDGTGIVWAAYAYIGDAEHTVSPGILRAFDASDVTKELWNTLQTPGDAPGTYAKFSSPTIANGHVYLPTFSNQVVVYGLK